MIKIQEEYKRKYPEPRLEDSVPEPSNRKFPELRLAHLPGAQGDNCLLGRHAIPRLPPEKWPGILISYYYLHKFLPKITRYAFRDWMLDSGAFSAYNAGSQIDLNRYIECCHLLLNQSDTRLRPCEIICLDVIGDGEGSLRNAYKMKEAGLDVIPVFHIGEDWNILLEYARNWNKVGLSCRFGEPVKRSMEFYGQCFSRIWPKKCHSFGWVSEEMLLQFPFHSSDSTDWEIKPAMYGTWRAFADTGSTNYLNWKGSWQDLTCEVEFYLNLEERLRIRWRKEMQVLENLPNIL